MTKNGIDAARTSLVIGSERFKNVCLRMDARGEKDPINGFGKVNCQFGAGPYEKFSVVPHPDGDGTIALVSCEFGTYLRMDGTGLTKPGMVGGIVNCQSCAGPYEKFRLRREGDDVVAIESVAFPGVVLRMDGHAVHSPQPEGAGTVNCRFEARSMERFHMSNADDNWSVRLLNPRGAFTDLDKEGVREQFDGSFIIDNSIEDHIQGMSSHRDHIIVVKNEVSHKRGTIVVMNRTSHRIVQRFDTPTDGYPHPDGGQVVGAYLAQAVENGHDGFVCFYNLRTMTDSIPPQLMPCRIQCRGAAGAVGISDVGEGSNRFHVVGVYDSQSVTFYRSNGKLLDDRECAFEPIFTQTLPAFPGDTKTKGADNICLVTDYLGRLFMFGFTSLTGFPFDRPTEDWAGLYAVDLDARSIEPVIQRHMVTSSGIHVPILDGVAFRWGAGLRIVSPVQLEFFCSSRNFSKEIFGAGLTINRFR